MAGRSKGHKALVKQSLLAVDSRYIGRKVHIAASFLFPIVRHQLPALNYVLSTNWQELDLGYFDFGMVTGSDGFLAIFISHKLFLESIIKLLCCTVRLAVCNFSKY